MHAHAMGSEASGRSEKAQHEGSSCWHHLAIWSLPMVMSVRKMYAIMPSRADSEYRMKTMPSAAVSTMEGSRKGVLISRKIRDKAAAEEMG